MIMTAGLRGGLLALLSASALLGSGLRAQAQLVDTPQNLLKAWSEAYAKRSGEPMTKLYAKDAVHWGIQAKEPSIGVDAIKLHYDRTGQDVVERSANVTKINFAVRKRVTQVIGTLETKSKLKDGSVRNNTARFTMSIIRESRRQWSIISHHVSLMPTN